MQSGCCSMQSVVVVVVVVVVLVLASVPAIRACTPMIEDGRLELTKMFCKNCGVHLQPEAKFCPQCGADNTRKRPLDENSRWEERRQQEAQANRAQPSPSLSFEAFREAKGKERASGFKSKKAKQGKSQLPAEVSVQIGVMQRKDGLLRIVRGSCLPLKVSPSVGAEELLTKARDKIVRFNQNVFAFQDLVTLIYPDRTEVTNLPGSTEAFIL